MKRLSFCLACGVALALAPTTGRAVDAPPADIDSLVRQLGDPSFRVRESAESKLIAMGRKAKTALLANADLHPEAEVRARCRRILPVALNLDHKARLEAFLADKDGKQEHDLGGWARFRKEVGQETPARELFAEMHKVNGELMELLDRDPEAAARECDRYARTIYGRVFPQVFVPAGGLVIASHGGVRTPPQIGEVATVLFVSATAGDAPPAAGPFGFDPTFNLLYQGNFQQAVQKTDGQGPALRKLLVGYIDTRGNAPNSVNQALQLAINLNLKECLSYAVKVAGDKNQQSYARGTALAAVARLGTKDNLAAVSKLLEDDSQVGQVNINGMQLITQVRDVALAVTIKLSGQQPKEFGFDGLSLTGGDITSPYYAGFPNNEKREAARKKWDEYLASQKK
jgi:hypothetical protein